MLTPLFAAFLLLQQPGHRTIAIDERLAEDGRISIGDRLTISSTPGSLSGDTVIVSAIVKRGADPAEIARSEYRVRMHLDHLQKVAGYGDRVDRFAVSSRGPRTIDHALSAINATAFGFQAWRSRDIAVETSRTFQVVSRFHKAIGLITIVASAIFLLCIMLLKVEERRRDVAALRLMGISRATVVKGIVAEAALLALIGCALGVALGWVSSQFINWYYQGIYRTPLYFSLITPGIVSLAVGLSLVLGIGAGFVASLRLVRTPPLTLFGR
ncbi:MAG TPA: FtsX-like permease family protein [Gemmatimonadaceae bacterium]|nr:FtsX-like permease family protein [Gemmatimonadaceae bacterium]